MRQDAQAPTPRRSETARVLSSFDEIASDYDVMLCDLWGCYHNGLRPYEAAVAALRRFRASGGAVILLTNAPRPNPAVRKHLDGMGAPADSFDAIVSSGDSARAVLASLKHGRKLYVIGPDRDQSIWEGLDVELTTLEQADAILCTGLFDDTTETPADYADTIAAARARDLPFLCANPDIIVDRGEQRLYCAGAIGLEYKKAGGRVLYFGKPHAPIYELAFSVAADLRPDAPRSRIIGVGDGPATDVLGAELAGVDCLFVTGGIAAHEVGEDPETPDPERLAAYLNAEGRAPGFAIGRLR